MGCGYLPSGCERYSVVNGTHVPRANDGLTIAKRGVKPTKHGGRVDTIIGHTISHLARCRYAIEGANGQGGQAH